MADDGSLQQLLVRFMDYRLLLVSLLTLGVSACGGSGGGEPSDSSAPGPPAEEDSSGLSFGSPGTSQIRPGVKVSSGNGSCTSNFIFRDSINRLYIGAAAHCFSPDTNSGVDSCEAENAAIGSAITIENATQSGTLVYSSWQSMKDNSETPGNEACVFNDFALVEISRADYDNVHPSAIAWGGPTHLLTGNADVNDQTYSYGQSSSHLGIRSQEEKDGPVTSQVTSGWQYNVSFDNPGLPGDSGSAVLHESGGALGVLTVVSANLLGPPVDNGVANLEMALDYANDSLSRRFSLVTSDDFNP
ncbi:MAG: hypothetical protein ACI9HX_000616 [Pseudoalteromonas tetraodonis]